MSNAGHTRQGASWAAQVCTVPNGVTTREVSKAPMLADSSRCVLDSSISDELHRSAAGGKEELTATEDGGKPADDDTADEAAASPEGREEERS